MRIANVSGRAHILTDTGAIEAAQRLSAGKGRGPLHHFHARWPKA